MESETSTQLDTKAQFLAAYDQYADEIYRFCLFKVSDAERAQDFTQDVFTRFWQSMRDDSVEYPRALLYTIARNRITDWYRKKKEQSLDVLQDEGFDVVGARRADIEQLAEHEEVLRAVDELDEPSRESILMRFMEGLTPTEIADITGETPNVISVRINRAIKKLQGRLHIELP